MMILANICHIVSRNLLAQALIIPVINWNH